MKRRKHLRGLAPAARVLDLLSLPLAPVLARQRYVDLLFYQEMLWDRSLVWQDPRGAASILRWWALGGDRRPDLQPCDPLPGAGGGGVGRDQPAG